jgi:predicted glycosyltransferase involved in capsule biosynthesis
VTRVDGERYFNKARAQNIGAANCRQPILFFCDCDIIVEPESVSLLANEVKVRAGVFATIAGVHESVMNSRQAGNVVRFGYELNLRLANGRCLQIVDHEEDATTGTRQAPGLLLVRRTDFLAINGYNGRLHGWGWEDQDMIARLTLGAALERVERGAATHLSHGDDERIAHYPPMANRWESRDRMFRQALAFYDASDLRGTYDYDQEHLEHEVVS